MSIILNLGCGTRTSPAMVNIDWSIHARLLRSPVGTAIASRVLRGARREAFARLDDNILVHDLRKGIPAATSSVDGVYHSHILEHVDRDAIPKFLEEVRRVLRPGGIHRIVVPDLESRARDYLASLESCRIYSAGRVEHDAFVAAMIEQMVRREAHGTSQQDAVQRWLENRILGDARKRGETHQWMWDEVNLSVVLDQAGFRDIQRVAHDTSAMPGWRDIGLDTEPDGSPYKPQSIYMEARA